MSLLPYSLVFVGALTLSYRLLCEGPDIHRHMDAVADQHNLHQYVNVWHIVIDAKWLEAKQKGCVTVVRTDGAL